ncbi:MAG: hypothetical protein ACLTKE_09825 [Coprococcus sp.]
MGIDGINVSLDTLQEEKFRKLTRNGAVKEVWKGISSVLPYDRVCVKINCVSGLENDWEEDAVRVARNRKELSCPCEIY